MTVQRFVVTWVTGAAFLFAHSLGAQDPQRADRLPAPPFGRILGVFDSESGAPISGAIVLDVLTGDHVETTATGTASLAFVRTKGSVIKVTKLGFQPWSTVLDPTDLSPITVLLERVQMLDAVVTRAKYNINTDAGARDGHEQRCAAVHVTCMSDSAFSQRASWGLGDFIAKADGVLANRRTGHGIYMDAATGGQCVPTYFVDGFRWDKPLPTPIDMPGATGHNAPFGGYNVASIEIYLTTTNRPARFTGNPSCGVIVLWTK